MSSSSRDACVQRLRRCAELDQARKLARVSARLAEALARLNGQTRHNIHVMHDAP